MSAYGYKQTSRGQLANVCLTPNSGHAEVLTFGGSAVAAVPGRSAQIPTQGDPSARQVRGHCAAREQKFKFLDCGS